LKGSRCLLEILRAGRKELPSTAKLKKTNRYRPTQKSVLLHCEI
jgi:hypothetical protein